MRVLCGLLLQLLVGCGSDVDLAPYLRDCEMTACPDPYECTVIEDWSGTAAPPDSCLIPCNEDDECPDGFFCKGVTIDSSFGTDLHCMEDV